MKKLLGILGLLILFGTASVAKGQTITALGNQARAAAHECWQPYHVQHSTVEAELALIADCIGGETGYGFNIMVYYHCPPKDAELCRPGPPTLAAFVYINCSGDIEVVECH